MKFTNQILKNTCVSSELSMYNYCLHNTAGT